MLGRPPGDWDLATSARPEQTQALFLSTVYENHFGTVAVGATSLLLGVLTLGDLTVVKLTGQPIGERPLLLAGVLFVVVGVQLVLFGLLAELVVNARNRGTERRT